MPALNGVQPCNLTVHIYLTNCGSVYGAGHSSVLDPGLSLDSREAIS